MAQVSVARNEVGSLGADRALLALAHLLKRRHSDPTRGRVRDRRPNGMPIHPRAVALIAATAPTRAQGPRPASPDGAQAILDGTHIPPTVLN
jgi:hypothetical protein